MEFDKVFRALGDKHRLFIMDLLVEREMNAGELLEKVNVVQSTLSHHMKCLCESGLVTARKEGKWTYYSVSSEAVEAARVFLKRYLEEIPEGTKVLTKKEVPEKEQDGQGRTVSDDRKKAKKKKADKEQKNGEKKKPGDKKKVPVKKENAKEGKKEEKKKQKRGDKKGSGKKGDRKARENTEKR